MYAEGLQSDLPVLVEYGFAFELISEQSLRLQLREPDAPLLASLFSSLQPA
jgi:hypothetical protein